MVFDRVTGCSPQASHVPILLVKRGAEAEAETGLPSQLSLMLKSKEVEEMTMDDLVHRKSRGKWRRVEREQEKTAAAPPSLCSDTL